MQSGDLILFANQAPPTANGIHMVGHGAAVRFPMPESNLLVVVDEGNVYARSLWVHAGDNFLRVMAAGPNGEVTPDPVTLGSESGVGFSLVGPNNNPPALKTRYLRGNGGILLRNVDGLSGIEVSAPNARSVVRAVDVLLFSPICARQRCLRRCVKMAGNQRCPVVATTGALGDARVVGNDPRADPGVQARRHDPLTGRGDDAAARCAPQRNPPGVRPAVFRASMPSVGVDA